MYVLPDVLILHADQYSNRVSACLQYFDHQGCEGFQQCSLRFPCIEAFLCDSGPRPMQMGIKSLPSQPLHQITGTNLIWVLSENSISIWYAIARVKTVLELPIAFAMSVSQITIIIATNSSLCPSLISTQDTRDPCLLHPWKSTHACSIFSSASLALRLSASLKAFHAWSTASSASVRSARVSSWPRDCYSSMSLTAESIRGSHRRL